MAKLKDGFYKQTASSIGSDLLVLLAGGGAKPISDFAQFNNAYWANIPISNTSSTNTNPTFANITLSGKMIMVLLIQVGFIQVDFMEHLGVSKQNVIIPVTVLMIMVYVRLT